MSDKLPKDSRINSKKADSTTGNEIKNMSDEIPDSVAKKIAGSKEITIEKGGKTDEGVKMTILTITTVKMMNFPRKTMAMTRNPMG